MTEPPDEPSALEAALEAHARVRRRALLRGAGALAVLGAIGGGGTLFYLSHKTKVDRAVAITRAHAAEEALLAGDIARAKKLAAEARELDPLSPAARSAYLRTGAFDLIDGDADANASVGLVAEARSLNATGIELALVSLAAAVGIRNDRLTERILKEPREDDVTTDGFYAFAAGAGSDLDCDPAAVGWYERAALLLKDPMLAQIRLARALLFAGEIDRAEKATALVPEERLERKVLTALVSRARTLAGKAGGPAPRIDRATIGELPRSLRALATALALQDPDQPWGQSAGLDVALEDMDTPLVAVLAGRIALYGGDRVSARTAAEAALRMRDELDEARALGARVALVDGDLAAARHLAADLPDRGIDATLQAIDAYEAGGAPAATADKDAPPASARWKLAVAALSLASGKAPDAPTLAAIDEGVVHGEPWADFLAIDAAFASRDLAKAKKIVSAWSNSALTPAQKARKERLDAGGTPRATHTPDPSPTAAPSAPRSP